MRLRYHWDALRSLYVRNDDELTPGALAMSTGFNANRIARRAKTENWEFIRARYRERMGLPRQSDILERFRKQWDAECAAAFKKLEAAHIREEEQEAANGNRTGKPEQC